VAMLQMSMPQGAPRPHRAPSSTATIAAESDALQGLQLWELLAVYGRRDYDPEKFTPYELRNGIGEDRVKERAVLAFAHYKEGSNDAGRSKHVWLTLEELVQAFADEQLSVLDHFLQNNTNAEWKAEWARLREQFPELELPL
jgi:hypothetical protein